MNRKPRDPAWKPVDYEAQHIEAVQACLRGEADAYQQKLAIDWIVETAAGTYELSYRSESDGGERETAFAEGRRFVGMQIVKLAAMSPDIIAKLRSQNG